MDLNMKEYTGKPKKSIRNRIVEMWTVVKKSLHCKTNKKNSSEVYEPKPRTRRNNHSKQKSGSSTTSRKSTLKDLIYGKKEFQGNHSDVSPSSVRSGDLINPVIHHVRLDGEPQRSRLPKSPLGPRFYRAETGRNTPGRHGGGAGGGWQGFCYQCGDSLARQDVESHFPSKHAVREVPESDSSRKIIEMIFKAGWKNLTNQGHLAQIERILKVHNSETKLAKFEEYREMVKTRANRLQNSNKHPRCQADGNELLRFYGTTLACRLGHNGSSTLCTSKKCNVCCILRHGFGSCKELDQSVLGVFTTSSSEAALRGLEIDAVERPMSSSGGFKKALILCRVIAGRVQKPVGVTSQDFIGCRRPGFDSLAGNLGMNRSHIEELYVLNPSALLPCFVIVCKS